MKSLANQERVRERSWSQTHTSERVWPPAFHRAGYLFRSFNDPNHFLSYYYMPSLFLSKLFLMTSRWLEKESESSRHSLKDHHGSPILLPTALWPKTVPDFSETQDPVCQLYRPTLIPPAHHVQGKTSSVCESALYSVKYCPNVRWDFD